MRKPLFNPGQTVQFVDKFGIFQTGTFQRYDAIPAAGNTLLPGYLVKCRAFGPNTPEIDCFIPEGHLKPGPGNDFGNRSEGQGGKL